jgi:2-polyprenyl-3-methyl-5-hydroxy-6-metoxy-1,4-benzoquinol methylase
MANTKMDYREQEKFLQGSRIWGGASVACLIAAAAVAMIAEGPTNWPGRLIVGTVAALAVFIYYNPDYLHITVMPAKGLRWEIKVRWRIIAAILIAGVLAHGRTALLLAVIWLVAANLIARSFVPARYAAAYFWGTDFVLLAGGLLGTNLDILLGTTLLAAAAHLSVVISEKHSWRWPAVAILSGWMVVAVSAVQRRSDINTLLACAGLLLVSVGGTVWLVRRAREQSAKNVSAAMAELIEFTGYSEERIRELWATSNRQLAANWQFANPAEDNPEQMAEWYRQNSELYLFDISAYNLEYKRIRSNMKVLRLAKGATLDYGAGNGEILLELARRGHRVAYYDVEGVTMRFARQRAEHQGLAIDFFQAKSELAEAARQSGFDTVFSFDVLEHMPDLPGELTFLSSLLSPGGLFVFDVPAGSTKAHPMHLNHNLNVLEFMSKKGLVDERNVMLRLPFRKEEKYVFRAPARETARAIGT